MDSALCGGVISKSQLFKGMEKHGVYFGMMAFVMQDKWYDKYIKLLEEGKKSQAKKIFDKHAMSQI